MIFFVRNVKDAPLAGNVDNPEGGLDALLQVMVCKDRIGWRPDSRKIILVATDNDYHNAMDGKLAGSYIFKSWPHFSGPPAFLKLTAKRPVIGRLPD